MIFIWLLLVSTLISVGKNNALNSSNRTVGSSPNGRLLGQRGIDEAMLERDWQRYLNQLKRLKLHEMKKAIRSRVLTENIRSYYSLKQIRRRLKLLKLYDSRNVEIGYVKNLIQGNVIYRTASGQGILYVKISETDEGDRDRAGKKIKLTRPIVVVVAGIGGSDWRAVHATIQTVTHLVTSYDDKKLSGFDWWIIPLLNPDGYVTSMDSKMSRDYKPNINPTGGCWGVNLDRNFLFQRDTCDRGQRRINCQEYPGEYPFSEIESSALRDFIFPRVDYCKVFVAIKEGAKALVYPFASTPSLPPDPHTVLQNLLCLEALELFDEFHSGEKGLYRFGNSGSVFDLNDYSWKRGLSSGHVEDWMRRHMGVPRSFAFHIANRDEPINRLEEYGRGTLEVIKVLVNSRRIDPYADSFDELITTNQSSGSQDLSKHPYSRPIPWGRELMNENLRDKINRGAKLEMPVEFTENEKGSRYDELDYSSGKNLDVF